MSRPATTHAAAFGALALAAISLTGCGDAEVRKQVAAQEARLGAIRGH